jgi:hypothetical protein
VERDDLQWHIAARPSDIAKLPEGRAKARVQKEEHRKASVRAKVEHPFRVIKRQFGLVKVRFRGLAKNTAHVVTLFALSNLWMARKQLMAMTGVVRLMVLVDVLFAGTGSAVVDVIDTVFVIDPPPDPTNTVSVNVPETPEARLAVVSVTLEVLVTKPIEPELRLIWAAVIARPAADKPSVTVTPDAALGPALAKVMM